MEHKAAFLNTIYCIRLKVLLYLSALSYLGAVLNPERARLELPRNQKVEGHGVQKSGDRVHMAS